MPIRETLLFTIAGGGLLMDLLQEKVDNRLICLGFGFGLLLDIFKEFGTDTYTGLVASVSMSCTETIFYTMSVYFMTAKVTKTRFTLPGALIATFAGLAASVVLAAGMVQATPAGMR